MKISFWQFFRLIFVIFSLYLMGDAFFRWDGFRYYGTFSEFLLSVALASVLWSIVAVLVTILIWLLFNVFEWFCQRIGWKMRIEHLLVFTGIFILLGVLAWKGKRLILPYAQTAFQLKLVIFICVVLIAVFMTWLLRNRAERLVNTVQEKVTPLVWIFGIFVISSVPLVAYYTWGKGVSKSTPQEITRTSDSDKNKPNIILVTFDALTARKMSLYGYHEDTTPFISGWAKTANVFTKAEAESNFTTSTTASLMTGKRVWTHQTYHIRGPKPVKSDIESLPAELKKNGYFNMAFIVNYHTSVNILGISNSFDIAPPAVEFSSPASLFGWKFGIVDVTLYRLFGDKIRIHDWLLQRDFILNRLLNVISRNLYVTEVPPEKVFNRFLKILDENPPEPFFAWIHVFPPHDPYLPPEPYKGFFNTSSEFRTFKNQEAVRLESFKYLFQYQPFPQEMQPSVDLLRAYYNEFIRYCDRQLKNFIDELEKRDRLNNTVIILSSDHGESFEHGYFTHGGPFLYEQVTHIPLIIKEHDRTEGQVINTLVEQIDIPATILSLANIPVPLWMEGRSLVPLLRGEELPVRHVFSMNFEDNPSRGHKITVGSIAVWEGGYKLIHYLEENKSLLFNLKEDPDELDNLFDREQEIGQHLLKLIKDNLEKANERITTGG